MLDADADGFFSLLSFSFFALPLLLLLLSFRSFFAAVVVILVVVVVGGGGGDGGVGCYYCEYARLRCTFCVLAFLVDVHRV